MAAKNSKRRKEYTTPFLRFFEFFAANLISAMCALYNSERSRIHFEGLVLQNL